MVDTAPVPTDEPFVLRHDDDAICTLTLNSGLFCSTPAVAVSRALAPKHTMELLLTGDLIDAEDAYRMGLVNRVVSDDGLIDATNDLAGRIAAKSGAVIAAGKQAYRRQLGLSVADAYASATDAMVDGLGRTPAAEGIGAFLDKRTPSGLIDARGRPFPPSRSATVWASWLQRLVDTS